ncbi:MAG TPA: hypothetical protein VEL76_37135 [Gemmataceae bacterium]|nr:hypothetical protein [Gemmataceae bacterium]
MKQLSASLVLLCVWLPLSASGDDKKEGEKPNPPPNERKLNYEKTFTISPGEIQSIQVDPPKGEQKVTVRIQSMGSPVDVYIVLEENLKAVKDSLLNFRKPDAAKVKAGKEKIESATLETTIPAGKGFAVMMAGVKKEAQVKVTLKGG